jgi:hypothetical protein
LLLLVLGVALVPVPPIHLFGEHKPTARNVFKCKSDIGSVAWAAHFWASIPQRR